jgi:hypothetical protein
MLILLFVVFLVLALGGSWGYSRYGWAGMSPAAVVILVVAVLFLTGNLRLH